MKDIDEHPGIDYEVSVVGGLVCLWLCTFTLLLLDY